MKIRAGVMLFGILFSCCMGFAEEKEMQDSGKVDAEWLFTLAVQKGDQHFSVSLMKQDELSFDIWGDDQPFTELRRKVSEEEHAALRQAFEVMYEEVRADASKHRGDQPAYVLENTTSPGGVVNFSGVHPRVAVFLHRIAGQYGWIIPFALQ